MDLDAILDDALTDFDHNEESRRLEKISPNTDRSEKSFSETADPKKKNTASSSSMQIKDPVSTHETDEVEEPDLLDSILDDALNDFDQEEQLSNMKSTASTKDSEKNSDNPESQFNGDLEKALEQMATHLMKGSPDQAGEPENPQNLDASIDQAVKMISEGAKNMSDDPQLAEMFSKMEGMEGMEDFFKEVMCSLDGMDKDGKESVDDMVEKMFGQMLQKEHFEQPMRDIARKYPAWLEENESKYSAEEFENYKKQYGCFQRILECYSNEPVDTNNIMELMKEMQLYGQPPDEIVADMIPNLDGDPSKIMDPKALEKCPMM